MSATSVQPRANATGTPPPRYKLAVARWFALFPLLIANTFVASPLLATMPPLLRVSLVSIVVVALMTWVTMPLVTKWLRFWLFPSNQVHGGPAV